jgi:hypothetical protein
MRGSDGEHADWKSNGCTSADGRAEATGASCAALPSGTDALEYVARPTPLQPSEHRIERSQVTD